MAFYREQGGAWLGKVNRGVTDRFEYLWEFKGEQLTPNEAKVFNFEADFVVPCRDEQLIKLIEERHDPDTPYSPEGNAASVRAIHARIKELGGEHLHWS